MKKDTEKAAYWTHVEAYEKLSEEYLRVKRNPWKDLEEIVKAIQSDKTEQGFENETGVLLQKEGGRKEGIFLDLGGGNGRNIPIFSFEWQQWVLADLARPLLDKAVGPALRVRFALPYLPFREQSFTAIMSIAVLHHLLSPEEIRVALNNIRRILKPTGNLLLTVWLKPLGKQVQGVYRHPWKKEGKVIGERLYYILSPEKWITLLEQTEYMVGIHEYFGGKSKDNLLLLAKPAIHKG